MSYEGVPRPELAQPVEPATPSVDEVLVGEAVAENVIAHDGLSPQPVPASDEPTSQYSYWWLPGETPKLYEHLGVRTYKKWLPTSGNSVAHKVGGISTVPQAGSREEHVEDLIEKTKTIEKIHLGFIALVGALHAGYDQWHPGANRASDAFFVGLQVAVNVYPILTQRYNRLRAMQLLERMRAVER